jgi:hypothetical protein
MGEAEAMHAAFMAMCAHRDSPDDEVFQDAIDALGMACGLNSGSRFVHTRRPSMKQILEFDDAGASDEEPAKGVTVGDIRAWHDQYDNLLTSWAECRALLSLATAHNESKN